MIELFEIMGVYSLLIYVVDRQSDVTERFRIRETNVTHFIIPRDVTCRRLGFTSGYKHDPWGSWCYSVIKILIT